MTDRPGWKPLPGLGNPDASLHPPTGGSATAAPPAALPQRYPLSAAIVTPAPAPAQAPAHTAKLPAHQPVTDARKTAEILTLYDDVAACYDSRYTSPIHVAEDLATELLLAPFINETLVVHLEDALVLDLGCGTGWMLDHFPHLTPSQYIGVDLSPPMVAAARVKHPNHVFFQDDIILLPVILDLPRPKPRPTLIVSLFGALSHLPPTAWAPLISEITTPECRYFLTLYTERATTRPSSLAHTHPHLISTPSALTLHQHLLKNHLPPGRIFGLNPWGDDIPPMLEGKGIPELTSAMFSDALSSQNKPDRRYILGISGKRDRDQNR